jgi:hypothetical protein
MGPLQRVGGLSIEEMVLMRALLFAYRKTSPFPDKKKSKSGIRLQNYSTKSEKILSGIRTILLKFY